MTTEENKALCQKLYDAINRKDFAALDDLCHDDFVFYSQVDTPKPGVECFVNSEKSAFDAFESFEFPGEQMIAEGDKVAVYLIFRAKNQKKQQWALNLTAKMFAYPFFAFSRSKTVKSSKSVHILMSPISAPNFQTS